MEKTNDLIIQQYLKEVSPNINCSKRTKKFFLRELRDVLISYADENADLSIDKLNREFGTPEEFARGLLDRKDYADLLKKANRKMRIWKWISIGLVALIIFCIFWIVDLMVTYGGTVTVTNPLD